MSRVARALRAAHSAVVRQAPTEVTVYRLTYAGDDDPYDYTSQHTYTAHRMRGTFAPQSVTHEPIEDQGTYGATITLNRTVLGFVPSQHDRVEVGGVHYNVVEAHDVEGAVVKLRVQGPAADPVETGDVTPPVITGVTATGGVGSFDVDATFSEECVWRARYRKPPLTGQFTTTAFSVTYTLTASGTIGSLDGGQYEVEVQAQDAAGNASRWYAAGTVTVAPDLGT
jgi:hypothetical protein